MVGAGSLLHSIMAAVALLLAGAALAESNASPAEEPLAAELAPYAGPTTDGIDAATCAGKVMCGYQGWFRAAGDGTANQWTHWSIDPNRITTQSLTVEMWPDLSDYPAAERFPVAGLPAAGGGQAALFSSLRPAVVDLHFQWMRDYAIDGVFVQRFLVDIERSNSLRSTGVLAYARNAANRTGRVFAITYDVTGAPPEQVYDKLVADWKFLVDRMQITRDKRYLHQQGKPVLMIYGFHHDRLPADLAGKIMDFFQKDPRYGAFLIGGVEWPWRTVNDAAWARVFRRFDGISPWNVGNYSEDPKLNIRKPTVEYWTDDLKEAHANGRLYMPVAYPGFGWENMRRTRVAHGLPDFPALTIPRRGGDFFWTQFHAATAIKADMLYIAMFDEVDEGTAIFKVSSQPPAGLKMITYEGRPSDWYLRLTGYGTRMFRGQAALTQAMPTPEQMGTAGE